MQEPRIVGKSVAIKELKSFIVKAAASDSNVLILGETGVGKELAARAIYFVSRRKDKPFFSMKYAMLDQAFKPKCYL